MNFHRHVAPSLVLALSCLALVNCTADAVPESDEESVASQGEARSIDPLLIEPADPNVAVLQKGDGWQRMMVTGNLEDPTTGIARAANDEILILEKDSAIDVAPLPAKARAKLKETAMLRKAARPSVLLLNPAASADDDDMVTVVLKSAADAAETTPDVAPPAGGNVMFFGCPDYDDSYSRSINFDKSVAYHKGTESGSFTGGMDFDAQLKANAQVTLRYRVHRTLCVPYAVSFKKVELLGTADLTANAAVEGTFEKAWSFKRTIAKPEITSFTFWAGPVPVYLKIRAPIEAGVDAMAKAELHANAKVIGKGTFNVACNSSSCSGSKSASLTFAENKSPTASVAVKVKVTPWASASVRAVLYSEDIAYGDVGVKGSLPAELWGYAGNTCGDANHDGTNEFVTALTLDMRAKVDIIAKAAFFGDTVGSWSWNVADRHIGFWSFGAGTALEPIFYSGGANLGSVTMRGSMRPCWPYTDRMHYRVTWSDGASSVFDEVPSTLFSAPHTFASYGVKAIKVEALIDNADRDPNTSASRNLYLSPLPPIVVVGGGQLGRL